jgi:hypothetical protein
MRLVISATCHELQLIIEAASLDNYCCACRRHSQLPERYRGANERCGASGFADRRPEEIASLEPAVRWTVPEWYRRRAGCGGQPHTI